MIFYTYNGIFSNCVQQPIENYRYETSPISPIKYSSFARIKLCDFV